MIADSKLQHHLTWRIIPEKKIEEVTADHSKKVHVKATKNSLDVKTQNTFYANVTPSKTS